MGVTMSVDEFTALSVTQIANLISKSPLSQYRQACIDFGINGDMLANLPVDQLANALRRAGVDNERHVDLFLEEIENIRSPKTDPRELDRRCLRELVDRSDSLDWDKGSDTSEWSGVSLDSKNRILGLNVAHRNLSGELPSSLSDMSNLKYLHATCNSFTGAIPDTIGGLKNLTSLKLDHNSLSGRLPASVTRLTSLTALDLAWNKITGTIPMKLGNMTSLRSLNVGMNKLNGAIPRELASLKFLLELRLRGNRLSGKIPPLLGNLSSLQALDLTSNGLQGHIPESLSGMTDLRELWLGGNNLVGGIPESLSKMEDLQSLDLSRNKLTGNVQPSVMSAISPSLVYLNLSHNAFDGELPIASLAPPPAGDEALWRGSNSGCKIDEEKRRRWRQSEGATGMTFSPLSYLNLSHNKFSGCICTGVGDLVSLETLDLSHNKLRGTVPPDIGNCTSLRVLSFSVCGLSGRLDDHNGGGLGNLRLMETLRLDTNTFEGGVPAVLGSLTRLEVLQLQRNCFSDHLPSTLGRLNRLWALTVRDNYLSGRVPDSLGNLTGLRSLRLEENPSLQGPIPKPLACRSDCDVRADESVLQDTEAAMLGSKLEEWFLMPRKAFLKLQELHGYSFVLPNLICHVSSLVPYECHVFAEAKGRRLTVRRREIAFFSHCWDLAPDQCRPRPEFLEGPYPDTPDRTKLRHMQACLEEAPTNVKYVWVDMLCVPLMHPKRRRGAGRSVAFYVQNSGSFYILAPDSTGLQRHKKRAWCRLEALCAICPYRPCDIDSAFSPKLSDPRDRQDIAEGTLGAIDAMELSGRMDMDAAKRLRVSCKRVLYGSQDWDGRAANEELCSLSGKTSEGDGSSSITADSRST